MKFRILEVEGLYFVARTKSLISCVVTAQLICAFVFAYEKTVFLIKRLNYSLKDNVNLHLKSIARSLCTETDETHHKQPIASS